MNVQSSKESCNKFETCSAALCPLDPHPRHYWYADTEICCLRGDVPEWVKIQRKIKKSNPDPHHYFTQQMIESTIRVTKDIIGIDDVGYNRTKEYEWLHARKNRHKIDNSNHFRLKTTGDKTDLNTVYNDATAIGNDG